MFIGLYVSLTILIGGRLFRLHDFLWDESNKTEQI